MEDRHLRGYIYAILASLSTAFMAVLIKFTSSTPVQTLVFFRSFVCFLFVSPTLLQGRAVLHTKRHALHFTRAIFGMMSIYAYFFSLRYLELTEAIVLSNTVPLFIPLVAWVWLRSPVTKKRVYGILLGFLGVAFVLQPGYGIFHEPASVIGLLGALAKSISFVSIRQLTRTEKAHKILLYYFSYVTLFSFIPMALLGFIPISSVSWMSIILIGFCGVIYQWLVTKSYSYMAAAKVGALLYTTVLFGAFFDWIIFGRKLTLLEIVGGICIILGGVIALIDQKKPLKLGKKPPAHPFS